jgi:hypothetical protein
MYAGAEDEQHRAKPGSKYENGSYNASAVKIYYAASSLVQSLVHFENKTKLFCF